MEGLEETFSKTSLCVRGTNDIKLPADLRKGLDDYFSGKGISIALLRKYYGFGESLEIKPTPEELRAATQAPF